MSLSGLEQKLGYKFSSDALLLQALTHRSFSAGHNERLEFLGDSVLNCCIASLIYGLFSSMPEGELSRLRANLVNQAVLAKIAADLGIGSLLRLGDGEIKTGGASRPSILGDALEAILGAVYLDDGFAAAARVVGVLYSARIETVRDSKPVKDAKTGLQEWLQRKHLPLPEYTVKRIEGESHRQIFHVQCEIGSFDLKTDGCGANRRLAEQDAAMRAFNILAASSTADLKHGR